MMATVLDRHAGPIDADFRILGPISVTVDGTAVKIATRRQRALLVLPLLNVGRVVPAERLIEQLWTGPHPRRHPSRCGRMCPTFGRLWLPPGSGPPWPPAARAT